MKNAILGDIGSIWGAISTIFGAVVIAIIWFVRLEGKVKTNEKLFVQFQKTSEAKDKKLDDSIDKLFDFLRQVETVVNRNINK